MARSTSIDLTPEMIAAAAESPRLAVRGSARRSSSATRAASFPRRCCSRPATARPACRISARSARWRAPSMVRHAFRVLTEDKVKTRADLLFRRHGRHAQDPGQRAGPRLRCEPYLHMPLTSVPDPVRRRLSRALATTTTRCCGASSTHSASTTNSPAPTEYYKSGRFDAMLLQRGRALRRDHGGHAADARRRTPGDLQPVPADLAEERPRALCADEGCRRQGRHHHLRRRGRHGDDAAGHRRPCEAAMEAGFRHALGGAWRRFRDVRQGPPDQRRRSTTASARSSAGARRSISSTNSSSTRTARRSRSRRATG